MMLQPVRDVIGTVHITVLGQFSPREIAPKPKTNPNPNPNPNQQAVFLQGNCLVAPQP